MMTDFYQQHADTYFERTVAIDPSSFLEPLAKHLKPGASILDVGCGSGRDMRWFKNRGFLVTGFERSPGLAELARQHNGCDVIAGDFQQFDFSSFSVDAILTVGSLVHLTHQQFPNIFSHITEGLKPGGHVFVNLKKGQGSYTDDEDRTFYLWRDAELRSIFKTLGFSVLDFSVQASKVTPDNTWLSYVLQ